MKKPVILFGVLMAGSLAFTSCTKNLKDDVSDLRKKMDSLTKSNAELEDEVGGMEVILGANEPITATTTFTDNNNATRTVKDTYKFKSSNYYTQRAKANSDGSYDIYVERFSEMNWNEGARVMFRYNPTTKEITGKQVRHYWDDEDNYNDRATFGYIEPDHAGYRIDIAVNSFNTTTGEISLNVSASGDADYAAAIDYNAPNPGKPYNTNFSFKGKVKIFPYLP